MMTGSDSTPVSQFYVPHHDNQEDCYCTLRRKMLLFTNLSGDMEK